MSLLDNNGLSYFWGKIKSYVGGQLPSDFTGATTASAGAHGLVPAPTTTDTQKFLRGDGSWGDGGKPMVVLSYGNSTWNDFIEAYNNHVIVYCKASSGSNPGTGNQTRQAFMAYVNSDPPTEVEFQYYRSVSSHSANQQGDQIFIYKLNKTNGWSVTTREASTKIIGGTNTTTSYSGGALTINATDTDTWRNISVNGVEKLGTAKTTGSVGFINGLNTTVTYNDTNRTIQIDADGGTPTDEKVAQNTTTANAEYRVLLSGTDDDTDHIEGAYKSGGFRFNPSINATMEGVYTNATTASKGAHAEGYADEAKPHTASGLGAHVEGYGTSSAGNIANGNGSHAEGSETCASGFAAHAEGGYTVSSYTMAHSEGNHTRATGFCCHAEGDSTTASGSPGAHAEGSNTCASGSSSHAEGGNTKATYVGCHAEGNNSVASGFASHAEGDATTAVATSSHTEGNNTYASGQISSHAEGSYTTASGMSGSHSEGYKTVASGTSSHAEGENTTASGPAAAHAEGSSTLASGVYSHAEGYNTIASGNYAHAEGSGTTASGAGGGSHAEGINTKASGYCSHAEGDSVIASGNGAHAEGRGTIADGSASHAEGYHTYAQGGCSHVEGEGTTATHRLQHVFGAYNVVDGSESTLRGNYIEIVGNGDSVYNAGTQGYDTTYSNARTLDWNGNEVLSGKLTVGTAPTNDMDVATKKYVDDAVTAAIAQVLAAQYQKGVNAYESIN